MASEDSPQPLTHEQFMRFFLTAERELLRYVMVLVPNVSDARDVVRTSRKPNLQQYLVFSRLSIS
jgi:hypothetical protein